MKYSHFYVDMMNDIIFCALKDYAAENASCVIKAIFEQQQGKCNNTLLVNSTYDHNNVSIAHLPRNQILCFVAEANYNSISTMILVGNFSIPIGIIKHHFWLITCMYNIFVYRYCNRCYLLWYGNHIISNHSHYCCCSNYYCCCHDCSFYGNSVYCYFQEKAREK